MPVLRVEGLYKVFGRRPDEVVDQLSAGASAADVQASGATAAVIDAAFEVEQGEIFVVMGLSGSGKSTLIRMLNGLVRPTAGHVFVGDEDIAALDPKGLRAVRQQRISMVFQHFALLPHRSVLENTAYALEVRGVDRRTRLAAAREALEMVGLEAWADHRPDELSGGMQQRVGLARALAAETDILLMDEAFSALDPLIRREMQDQLMELQARLGRTIVFITHDLNEAMRLGDRVAVMRDGRIVRLDTPEAILADPGDEYLERFLADVDRSRVFTAGDVMSAPVAGADGRPVATAVTVAPNTPLADLLEPSALSEAPLLVADDTGEALGVVTRGDVLAALGGVSSGDLATRGDTTDDPQSLESPRA
ncbi:quaternary amine ABC transporter ATP-binding protein [Blastococcus capsensis]|uniref:quaternary amine ABC transporter ATP-binding protein n=1 Tax=Blastococcus capsensis TaxID=1564163 RepID=UPI0025405454|nr:betaine/proline/choline family ABC transporter ATP-binding protein [Blastococcus capsensis]MDK3258766.1 betaine/proline/choline family ABC transporter ATP-binding protein [Blastococcus capsensis]